MPRILLQALLNWILSALALPNPHDGASVRAWLQKLVALVAPFMEKVTVPALKAIYQALGALLTCDDCWAKLWAVVELLLGQPQRVYGSMTHPAMAELVAAAQAKNAQISPEIVQLIVNLILALLKGLGR